MASTTPVGIKATSIKAPTGSMDNHTMVLQQLKETTEIAQRLRGDPQDSYVRVSELVAAGLIRLTGVVVQPGSTALATSAVPASRNIFTSGSLTGGGNLSADRTLSLVNDNATPGNSYFYGTNGAGVKGWYVLSTPTAAQVSYSNTLSGLPATNVQDAIDELAAAVGGSGLTRYQVLAIASLRM